MKLCSLTDALSARSVTVSLQRVVGEHSTNWATSTPSATKPGAILIHLKAKEVTAA